MSEGFAGMWNLIGTLDPHSGQILKAAMSAWRRNDQTAGDTRNPAQRDVDALVGIASAWMSRTETVTRGRGVQLVVTVPEARLAAHQSQRDLYGVPVTCPDSGARLPDPRAEPLFTRDGQLLPHTDTTGADATLPPELLGDPVPPATYLDGSAVAESALEMLLCNATLTRVVLDQDSAVLDVGRGSRVFTHPQWLASMTQWDWQCATDGCQAPADRLELHHALWWRDGGTTDLVNCAPLCHGTSSCHSRVHDGATLRLRDGRLLDQRGFRPATPDSEQPWPPPLTARPAQQPRSAAAATHRLHTILGTAAA
ncbi:MAG: HNH endonuclease signature motif containing protein [Mycobacteriales bacterium]|nr:HNH endonuclease signature motif containing protein [Mycobacteriales bacterium]